MRDRRSADASVPRAEVTAPRTTSTSRPPFARYRRIARHGIVAERAEHADEANGAPVPSER
jgi:hypothetical protein